MRANKNEHLHIRLTAIEKALIEQEAENNNLSVSDYVRRECVKESTDNGKKEQ